MWLTRNSHSDLRAVRQFNSNLDLPSRYRDIRYAESPRHPVTASQRQLLDFHLPAVNFSAPHLQLPRTRTWLFPMALPAYSILGTANLTPDCGILLRCKSASYSIRTNRRENEVSIVRLRLSVIEERACEGEQGVQRFKLHHTSRAEAMQCTSIFTAPGTEAMFTFVSNPLVHCSATHLFSTRSCI